MPIKIFTSANTVWHSVRAYAVTHKVISAIGILLILCGVYYAYGVFTAPSTATRYITTTVATGTVVATLTETGQVSASSNITLQSKSAGEVLGINISAGQHVNAGAVIAYLDATTARQQVTSARQALKAAQISLAKLQEPATVSSLTSAQNALASAQENMVNAHQTSYNNVASALLDIPNVITSLDTVLHGTTVPGRTSQQNANAYSDMTEPYDPAVTQYRTAAEASYQKAQTSYTKTLADYKATSRTADDMAIEALVKESYQTAADLSDALKASTNFLNFVDTTLTNHNLSLPSTLTGHLNTLTSFTATINNTVALLSADVASVASDARAIAAAEASLAELQSGANQLDVESSQLSIQMKEDALVQAEQALADTAVTAPFSGTVAALSVQRYQTIGNGAAIATMVSDNQNVNISINEVDAAKLKVGQKATLTFDALPSLSISGTVSSVNTIGTVTSGVVSYSATITFDTPNNEVKPGMSATADIVIGSETGLVAPASAVKTVNGRSFVLVFDPPLPVVTSAKAGGASANTGVTSPVAPTPVPVVLGLSSDSDIIIKDGLAEGAQVVARTITGTATASSAMTGQATQSTSLFGGGGAGGGGGASTGAVRALTR